MLATNIIIPINQLYQGAGDLAIQNIDMAALFPEIDENKTASKAMRFLKTDFPKMLRVSGRSITDLKSPIISDMPKGNSFVNQAEETIIRRMAADQIVRQTRDAIYHCDAKSNHIRIIILKR